MAVKPAIVEARVCVADTDGQGRACGVRSVVIDEVDVVGAEIGVAERRARRHRVPGRPSASQAALERRRNGQRGCVSVVKAVDLVACRLTPENGDAVGRGVIGGRCLTKKREGAWTCDVDLLDVGSRQDQDGGGRGGVAEGEDGGLDGGESVVVAGGDSAIGAHKECPRSASVQGICCGCLAI